MAISPGTRLGPYEIVAPLGAGGMGEVFRARDTRLAREVALKVLPAEFSDDPARRSRFEQEARAAAALNHPNIVGIYDVGTEAGVSYLITELVPGETLGDLIRRGPVHARKLLDIAVQIADGMAAAHAAHITHRDLKPPNIMLTTDGRAKILDFGLAKQAPLPSASPDETPTMHQTQAGMILGTVNYMSPEQARGTPADHRSDQFSFGLILYEMASGRKAFEKPEIVQTMAAILSDDPEPLDARVPAPLRWVIGRCLAKEPDGRYESSRDLHHELRSIRDHLTLSSTSGQVAAIESPAAAPHPLALRRREPWRLLAAAAVAFVAAIFAGRFFTPAPFPDQSRYRFTPFAFEPGGEGSPVFSPDGKAVAFAASLVDSASVPLQVFVRYLDSPVPVQITRLAQDTQPIAWAPDSKRILFRSAKTLWSVSVVGGEPEQVMPLGSDSPVAVSPDLRTVALIDRGEDGLYGVYLSSPPGAPKQKYLPDPVNSHALYNDTQMAFSPDGKSILLFMKGDRNRDEVWLMPYPPSASKPPRAVLANAHSYSGTPSFAWMPDSRRVVLSLRSLPGEPPHLWLADTASENLLALTSGTTGRGSLTISPDGRKIVFAETTGKFDVVSVDIEHAVTHRLISTERDDQMPAWAVSQPLMVFVTNRNGPEEIWLHDASGAERPLVTGRDFPPESTQWFIAPALSPDGGRVIYNRLDRQGHSRLWISAVAGGAPVPLTNQDASPEYAGSWSSDSAWFSYLSIIKGQYNLMKVKTSGQATPAAVKAVGQSEVPSWSPDGKWILCGNELISPDGATTKPLGSHGTPNYVFSKDGRLLYGLRVDGDRTLLFSLDVANGAEKLLGDVGADFAPGLHFHPGIRFSLAPDGKSFAYTTGKFRSNLWLFEGFAQ